MIVEEIGNGISVIRPAPDIENSSGTNIISIGHIIIDAFFYTSLILLITILICLLVNRIKKGKFSFGMIAIGIISFAIFVVATYSKYGCYCM